MHFCVMVEALVTLNRLSARERLPPFIKTLLQEKLIAIQYSTRSRNTAE